MSHSTTLSSSVRGPRLVTCDRDAHYTVTHLPDHWSAARLLARARDQALTSGLDTFLVLGPNEAYPFLHVEDKVVVGRVCPAPAVAGFVRQG